MEDTPNTTPETPTARQETPGEASDRYRNAELKKLRDERDALASQLAQAQQEIESLQAQWNERMMLVPEAWKKSDAEFRSLKEQLAQLQAELDELKKLNDVLIKQRNDLQDRNLKLRLRR